MRTDKAEIIRILMERDGDTKQEAIERFEECRKMVAESGYDYNTVEDILAEELGLEMDYIFALL